MQLLPKYWPGFPYAQQIYDAFLPMGYYGYRANAARRIRLHRTQRGDYPASNP